ncbi:uncharacterized protein JCM15063_003569 [Sporobolomyces koalae]|uniref:uncharacterized protein n=1 Tax=Sporobolomyces koalae TaxID=500713 RepID=UPI00317E2662
MSTYQPNVNPTSEEGQALQAAIQKQLASLEWSTEDDPTMAEYCLVMLGNRKTPDQISTELSDLIGGDFDPSFVTWLFDEVKNHYPEPSAPPAASPAPASSATSNAHSGPTSSSIPTGPSGLPNRPAGSRSMFGAAVSGVKRDSREMGADRDQPPLQRQRYERDQIPSGPRNGGKSLFDRMGGNNAQYAPGPRNSTPPMINNLGIPQQAFDAITQTIQAVIAGAHPSSLATIPFPALMAHPLASSLPPPVLGQAQAHAMAQAQAFAQMQNVWNSPATGFGGAPPQQGFNPQAAPFNPQGGFNGSSKNGPFRGGPAGAGQRPPHHQHNSAAAPAVALPKKPENEAICKHGVDCTKPPCGFSHPSPVATKESGLVLSSESCDKQLSCQDPDCPKSHVSKAQKNASASTVASSASAPAGASTSAPLAASAPAPAVSDPSTIPGAGSKPCKFGSACTRPGCVFKHPWDVRGDPNGGTVPCRYGAACTRPGCHFSHPPKTFNRSNFSATFNKPGAAGGDSSPSSKTSAAPTIGAWPKEKPEHVSERLKRFAASNGDEATEKIIPGQLPVNGNDESKVEIHLDDEVDKKEKIAA